MTRWLKQTYPLFFRFAAYLRPVRLEILACIALDLIAASLGLWILSSISRIIDDVFVGGNTAILPTYLFRYGSIIFIAAGIEYGLTRLNTLVTEKIELALQVDLFRHVLSLSPGSLPNRGPGEILSHLISDASRVEYLVYSGPLLVSINLVRAVAYGVLLLSLNWQLTLCALATLPFLALSSGVMSRMIRKAGRSSRRFSVWRSSLTTERLGAGSLIQTHCTWEAEAEDFRKAGLRAQQAELRDTSLQAALALLTEGVGAATSLLLLTVGALQIAGHHTTVGAFVAFAGSVGSLILPSKNLARSVGKFHRAAIGAQRFADILDTPSRVKNPQSPRILKTVVGDLALENVRFGYDPDTPVLNNFNLKIRPGEKVALVGASGCGKSTITRLLLRLYDPQAGCVKLDGVDLRELEIGFLRRSVNLVAQDPVLLNTSILANITYGQPELGAIEAWEAAEKAGAYFINGVPGRLAARVGPDGERLSGGQRQRIALARALLRPAPVMILDEATAAIDSEGEALFQEAIGRTTGVQTTLIVAHRLSSIQKADRIIVLEGGHIVESGGPARLLGSDSRFRQLFAAQIDSGAVAA
ncbi:MAG: hypothetical protein CGW95_02550 [Phenylobacterium zucineum]|nr:MAG: hypothetical protein CGW95_02550 [Phenylobacterium zucineum]